MSYFILGVFAGAFFGVLIFAVVIAGRGQE